MRSNPQATSWAAHGRCCLTTFTRLWRQWGQQKYDGRRNDTEIKSGIPVPTVGPLGYGVNGKAMSRSAT